VDDLFEAHGAIIPEMHQLDQNTGMAAKPAVGADSSRPSPIYRPPKNITPLIWSLAGRLIAPTASAKRVSILRPLLPDYFVKAHHCVPT